MTIEYLGQKFVGDLLHDGRIKSQETDIIFPSPSSWAVACKRFINPDRKSGCGWASIRYKGKKLDAYKNIWYSRRKQNLDQESIDTEFKELEKMASSLSYSRIVVKHNTIANRTLTHDANSLIECIPFSNLGKIQPFLVILSTNAALVMDYHSHLTRSEVSGYLAGHWDVNTHSLQITHAFPCRNTKSDREQASQTELEICKGIEKDKLLLVGWYHSHPFSAAAPTLRDVDAQLDYQIKMKGQSDNSYTPCIGIIISPYNYENASLESSIVAYWVIPPPENKPNEYGRPMLMSYSVSHDNRATDHVRVEIERCFDYYKKEKDFVDFNERFVGSTTYIDKLKSTLVSKFPREENETVFWKFISENVGCSGEENDILTIPSVSKLPTLNTPVSINSMMDISSLLYSSGKFTSGASGILGLPDPMAHSTLATNNMFLQSNLFKMQELLKPPPPPRSTSKKDMIKSQLKIPTDLRPWKNDYPDVLNLKSNYLPPDLGLPNLGDFGVNKSEEAVGATNDYGVDLSKTNEEEAETKSAGYSMLNLSTAKNAAETLDLSQPSAAKDVGNMQSLMDLE